MIRINLLPVREARRKADLVQQLSVLGLAVALSVGACGVVHWITVRSISNAQARLASMNAEIDKFKPQVAEVEAFRTQKEAMEKKLDVIKRLDRQRSGPVHLLDELATRSPDRLWITKLVAKDGAITMQGLSLDNEIIAGFLTALNQSGYFKNADLGESKLTEKDGLKLNSFTIRAQLTDPESKKAEEAAASTASAVGTPATPGDAKAGAPAGGKS